MKTRTGFVSNSSSSSFVVAFPKKPKTADEVAAMLFGSNKHGTTRPYDFCEATSNQDVANRVFRDIKNKKPKKSEVVEEFSNRYFCLERNRPWYAADKYCSTDDVLMQRLMELMSQHDEIEDAGRKMLEEMVNKVIPKVPYAYKGGYKNYQTKALWSDEEVKAYEKYSKKTDKFERTNKEYIKARNKFWVGQNKRNNEMNKLRKEIATLDADNFYADHKGHFIIVLTYGDENGEGNLEHGNIFGRLPYVQISHH